MKYPQVIHGNRSSHLYLYPPLKQPSKDRLTFASTNTRHEQVYVRKLIVKRVVHFNDFEVFKTIILDARFIKKAWRNLLRSKSFHNVEIFLSEPGVFDLLTYVFRELPKKTIHTLTIHLDIKKDNKDITKLIRLLQPIKKVQVLRMVFEGTDEAAFLDSLPAIYQVLEPSVFMFKRIYLDFQGITAFLVNNLVQNFRFWSPNVQISLTPSELREPLKVTSHVNSLSTMERCVRSLKVKFANLKRFDKETLNTFLKGHETLTHVKSLTLVLNRLELNEERAQIFEKYLKEMPVMESLQLIVYYLKFHKMNYGRILETIKAKGSQLRKLVMGHIVIKESFKSDLVMALKKAESLESLRLYWDIKEIVESHKENKESLWEFLDTKPSLKEIEMIIMYQTTILEENGDIRENIEKSLRDLFKRLARITSLERLTLVFPEVAIEIGEMVNEMVIESQGIQEIRIDCEQYNVNYLWELREIQRMKNIKVEVNTGQKEQLKEDLNGDNFELKFYPNSYDYFAQVHQDFYCKYI